MTSGWRGLIETVLTLHDVKIELCATSWELLNKNLRLMFLFLFTYLTYQDSGWTTHNLTMWKSCHLNMFPGDIDWEIRQRALCRFLLSLLLFTYKKSAFHAEQIQLTQHEIIGANTENNTKYRLQTIVKRVIQRLIVTLSDIPFSSKNIIPEWIVE